MLDDNDRDQTVADADDSVVDNRRNIVILAVLAVVLLAGGIGYLFYASSRADSDLSAREARALEAVDAFEQSQPRTPVPTAVPPEVVEDLGPVPQPGEVVVINRVPGDDYGRLAIRHADGSRTLLDRTCLRVHIAAGNGVCLSQEDSIVPQFTSTLFDATDPAQRDKKRQATGLPSRARVSPGGTYAAATTFISGTSYEDIGGETSTLVIVEEFDRNKFIGPTQFVIDSTERRYGDDSGQYWGVSFVDENSFYVTGFYDGAPEVMLGTIDDKVLVPTGYIGSCPSISPDNNTLIYKRTRSDGGFDLVAVDLRSDEEWILGETRSVDDQVEWLDNDTILYAIHPEGGDTAVQPQFDIWMLDIAPGSEPALFLPAADSPTVIR